MAELYSGEIFMPFPLEPAEDLEEVGLKDEIKVERKDWLGRLAEQADDGSLYQGHVRHSNEVVLASRLQPCFLKALPSISVKA
jgi:hypothetical protein